MYQALESSESDFLIKLASFAPTAKWEVLNIKIYVDTIKNPHTKTIAVLTSCSK